MPYEGTIILNHTYYASYCVGTGKPQSSSCLGRISEWLALASRCWLMLNWPFIYLLETWLHYRKSFPHSYSTLARCLMSPATIVIYFIRCMLKNETWMLKYDGLFSSMGCLPQCPTYTSGFHCFCCFQGETGLDNTQRGPRGSKGEIGPMVKYWDFFLKHDRTNKARK